MIIVIMFKEYGKYVIIVEKFYVKFKVKYCFKNVVNEYFFRLNVMY